MRYLFFITFLLLIQSFLHSKEINSRPYISINVEFLNVEFSYNNSDKINIQTEDVIYFDKNFSLREEITKDGILSIKIQKKVMGQGEHQNIKILLPTTLTNLNVNLTNSSAVLLLQPNQQPVDYFFSLDSGNLTVEGQSQTNNQTNNQVSSQANDVSIDVTAEYGSIKINNVKGNVYLVSKSGDLFIDNVSCKCDIQNESGDISLKNSNGDFYINTVSGDVTLQNVEPNGMKILTESGDVDVAIDDISKYKFTIATNSGDLMVDGVKYYQEVEMGAGDVQIESKSISGNQNFYKK